MQTILEAKIGFNKIPHSTDTFDVRFTYTVSYSSVFGRLRPTITDCEIKMAHRNQWYPFPLDCLMADIENEIMDRLVAEAKDNAAEAGLDIERHFKEQAAQA